MQEIQKVSVKQLNGYVMNCKESRRKISILIWDGVPLPEDLVSHINECESCSMYYSNFLQGIKGILKHKRIEPDPDLWKKVVHKTYQESNHGKTIKLALSLTSAAAAVITGIITANLVIEPNFINDKEQYKQEISFQTNNLSGLEEGLIEYYNYENPAK